MTLLNTTITISSVELHTTTKLPSVGKEYLCFQINRRSSHVAQCVKLRILNKDIDYILSIDTFEQKCVVIKGMLHSPCLDDHTKTIGVDPSSFTRSPFEQKCLNSTKKIYQHAGKCDNQQNLKDIIDADMVLTPEEVTYESTNVPTTSTPVKNKVIGNHCVYSPTD